jgi:hypothetical protein
MDFITGLPVSDEADEIWVIVDRYTKMAHFVPLKIGSKTAADLARIFAKGNMASSWLAGRHRLRPRFKIHLRHLANVHRDLGD